MSVPSPPISLPLPQGKLSADQRAKIINWLSAYDKEKPSDQIPTVAVMHEWSDAQLRVSYTTNVTVSQGKQIDVGADSGDVVDAITSPLEFLNKLQAALFSVKFWIRALELQIALLLIGIGLAKLASGTAVGNIAKKTVRYQTRKVGIRV